MPTTQTIAETDEGRLILHGNELELYDKSGGDPVAIRLRSGNGGIGKISVDAPDGHGGWTEIGYVFGKRDERPGMGQKVIFEFWQSGSSDGDAKRLLEVRHDQALFHVPTNSGGPSAHANDMWSPNGLMVTQQQDDGNFVSYRLSRPFDKSANPVPIWSAWSGPTGR